MRHSKRWLPVETAAMSSRWPGGTNRRSPIGTAGSVPGGSAALSGGTTPVPKSTTSVKVCVSPPRLLSWSRCPGRRWIWPGLNRQALRPPSAGLTKLRNVWTGTPLVRRVQTPSPNMALNVAGSQRSMICTLRTVPAAADPGAAIASAARETATTPILRERTAGGENRLVVRFVSVDRKLPSRGEVGRIPSLEVVMRPPSVFVRDLLPEEGNRLKRLSRKASSEVKRERALIVWASATRMSPQQIAALVGSDESHVRKVIHAFNERGFDSLDPEQRGGRPRRITDEQRARIVAVAGARPDTLGVPATRWSLTRLARYLREQRIVQVSPAHLGRILAQAGLSFQRTRTWKASPDPAYEARATRVLALYAKPPEDGVVISFDQMGPISSASDRRCRLGAA